MAVCHFETVSFADRKVPQSLLHLGNCMDTNMDETFDTHTVHSASVNGQRIT